MQKPIVVAMLLAATVAHASGSNSVKGHFKKDGTFVQPYMRTNPDSVRRNNYNSEGNFNPYSGKQGKQHNEFSSPPQYNDSYNDGQGKRLNQLYGNPSK